MKPLTLSSTEVRDLLSGSIEELVIVREVKPQPQGDVKPSEYNADGFFWCNEKNSGQFFCPLGNRNDRLYVKERFDVIDRGTDEGGAIATLIYLADGKEYPLTTKGSLRYPIRPKTIRAYWMPRLLSRLTLQITEVLIRRIGGKWFWFVTAKKV